MHTHTNREKLVASASTLSTPLICTQLRTQHVQPKSSHVHLQLVVRREPRRAISTVVHITSIKILTVHHQGGALCSTLQETGAAAAESRSNMSAAAHRQS